MQIYIRQSAGKIISIFILVASFVLLPHFVFASSTDGTINSIYKYGWSENIGWINFGAIVGNTRVTDSGLFGYGWSSNYGWINLNPPGSGVKNDGIGALSGSAWGENTGWINFAGVSIDSNGYFSGYATGDVTGRISFNCSNTNSCPDSDFKVQTDWRPRVVRPQCNNAIDDDGDGLTDYSSDLGCESLEDNNEINEARVSADVSASISESLSSQTIGVLINNGDKYTNSADVVLTLFGGYDVENISISNSLNFEAVSQIPFQKEIGWNLCQGQGSLCKDKFQVSSFKFQVYVKFYTKYGKPSEIFSDTIILDVIAPELTIDSIKDYYIDDENIILTGKSEEGAEIILYWNNEYDSIQTDNSGYWKINLGTMSAGDYILDITAKDLAGNKSGTEIIKLTVKPAEKKEVIKEKEEKEKEEVDVKKSQKSNVETLPEVPIGEHVKTEETILEKIEKLADTIIHKIIDIIKPYPKTPETQEAQIVIVPKEPSLVFKSKWNLLPKKAIDRFVLAPLPTEFEKLAEKFPKLEQIFEKVGVKKFTDLKKLASTKLTLPGLTERVGIKSSEVKIGEFAIFKSVPLAKLSPQIKAQLPTEIVFAETGGELIDFNIALSISEKGQPQQKISTISGKPLYLVVKPDKSVTKVRGYVIFKSHGLNHAIYDQMPEIQKFQVPTFKLQDLLTSTLFALPAFAQSAVDVNYIALEGSKISDLILYANAQETRLVLMEFEYTDTDGDGIYTAQIQSPVAEGEYEIITVMDFEDPELGSKEIRLITVVDPEGYVYEGADGKEIRIPGAIISLYSLNLATKQYEIWQAQEYQQENPQITDNTGKYSFLVPEGFYYLKIEAPGYLSYEGKSFEVTEGSGIHENIGLKTKYWWTKIVDWKTVALIVVILFLMYNFYRDRKRAHRV